MPTTIPTPANWNGFQESLRIIDNLIQEEVGVSIQNQRVLSLAYYRIQKEMTQEIGRFMVKQQMEATENPISSMNPLK